MATDHNAKLTEVPGHIPPECVVDWDFNDVPGAESDVYQAWKKLQEGPPVHRRG